MGAVLLLAPLPAAASERTEAARRAADYLVDHQAADGTFFGDDASHRVAETLVALVSGGVTGAPVSRALAAATARGPGAADTGGEAGLLVLGVVAAGGDPRDYVARVHSFYDERLGAYNTQQFQNALALLGVVAAGEKLPDKALTFLRLNRCADGGIPIQAPCRGVGGHVDVTALVVQALVADGVPASDPLRADARSFLAAARNAEGGFGDAKGASTNANSTALVLAAVAALGEPTTDGPWRDARRLLLSLQQPDGRFHQNASIEGDSYLATRQAIPGVAGRPYPVQPNPSSPGKDASAGSAATTSTWTTTITAATRSSTPPRSVTTTTTTSTTAPTAVPILAAAAPVRAGAPPIPFGAEDGRPARPIAPAVLAAALLLIVFGSVPFCIGSSLGRPVGFRGKQ